MSKESLNYLGVGLELIGFMLGAAFIGSHLDDHYPSGGLWTVALIVLSLVVWFTHVWKLMKRLEREDEDKQQ